MIYDYNIHSETKNKKRLLKERNLIGFYQQANDKRIDRREG